MATWRDIERMCNELLAAGQKPGAIIASRNEFMALLSQRDPNIFSDPHSKSNWAYRSLPLMRSDDISGPCVVSEDIYRALQRMGRDRYRGDLHSQFAGSVVEQLEQTPILF